MPHVSRAGGGLSSRLSVRSNQPSVSSPSAWLSLHPAFTVTPPGRRGSLDAPARTSDGDSSSGGGDDEDDGGGGDGEDDDAPAGRRAVASPAGQAPTDTGKRKRTLGQGLRLGGGGGGGGGRGRATGSGRRGPITMTLSSSMHSSVLAGAEERQKKQ